jgi:hypothetical protein
MGNSEQSVGSTEQASAAMLALPADVCLCARSDSAGPAEWWLCDPSCQLALIGPPVGGHS